MLIMTFLVSLLYIVTTIDHYYVASYVNNFWVYDIFYQFNATLPPSYSHQTQHLATEDTVNSGCLLTTYM